MTLLFLVIAAVFAIWVRSRFQKLEWRSVEQELLIAALTERIFTMQIGGGGQPAKAAPPPLLPVPPSKPPRELEAVISANWLSKRGVLMLLIGIALFLGFSLTEMSPP